MRQKLLKTLTIVKQVYLVFTELENNTKDFLEKPIQHNKDAHIPTQSYDCSS